MKNKFLRNCIICIFLSLLVLIGICEQIQGDIADGIVRLHIVANSDKEIDQQIKLSVRDAIIKSQEEIFPDGMKKKLAPYEKRKIIEKAKNILRERGVNYGVAVETGSFFFPTKKYDNITLPAGEYDAVRVVLGEGKGKNWWCVMYPPLCFSESAIGKMNEKSDAILKESMGDFQYAIISEENIKTVPAFKLVEMWQSFKEKIKKNL